MLCIFFGRCLQTGNPSCHCENIGIIQILMFLVLFAGWLARSGVLANNEGWLVLMDSLDDVCAESIGVCATLSGLLLPVHHSLSIHWEVIKFNNILLPS